MDIAIRLGADLGRLLDLDYLESKMKYTVSVEVEAKDGEDACYRVLGWEPKFVRQAVVSSDKGSFTFKLGRRGYEGWEPCWFAPKSVDEKQE